MNNSANGRGYLYYIGVGPGSPMHMTLRARHCLTVADLIVYDDDVDARILMSLDPAKEIVIADQQTSIWQDKISQQVKAGNRVARLLSGAGWRRPATVRELSVMLSAGLAIEVVPGVDIDIAAAAFAGIGFDADTIMQLIRLDHDHKNTDRPLILSHTNDISDLVSNLKAQGLSGDTAAAFVAGPGTVSQDLVSATLDTLIDRVSASGNLTEGVVIIGLDPELTGRLNWIDSKPLSKQRIIVTRAAHQAGNMLARLEDLGAEVIPIPTIELSVPKETAVLDQALTGMASGIIYDWIVFTSANGVDFFFDYLQQKSVDIRVLAGSKIAAIGPATAKALNRRGLIADLIPDEYIAEGLLEAMAGIDLKGKQILIPRALEAREVLPETLRDRGAEVTVAPVYETHRPQKSIHGAGKIIGSGTITMIAFTSSSTVINWLEMLKDLDLDIDEVMKSVKVACIGPITSQTARRLGLSVDIEAGEHTVDGLIDQILTVVE